MEFDSIGFDLDGTLWSSIPAIIKAWDIVAEKYKVDVPSEEDMKGVMGLNRFDLMTKLFPKMSDEVKDKFFVEATAKCEEILNEQGGILFEKMEETLNILSRKYKLYIVSNCQDGYIESFLKFHKLSRYFVDFECAGTKNLTKGKLIENVIVRNNLKNTIYVGDTQGDYNAACEAGIDFIFTEYGFGEVENCKYRIKKFSDLPSYLINGGKNMNARYAYAKEKYAEIGIDTDAVIEKLSSVPVSMHCWQGDDVTGFDSKEALSGGIQTTGNYPGKARNPQELMADIDKVFSLIPGKKKLNLHASYAIFENGEFADRDKIEPKHFAKWVEYAKQRNIGIDFNPTFFSHPMVKDNLTLSSPDEDVRKFWVEHGKACLKISEYFANETGVPCVMNIWIPDGYKDIPADRIGPRARFKKSLDEILSVDYDRTKVYITLESKVFGIGLESYTVGSAEFGLSYVNSKGITPLMDNGHYHPTEVVSDKISSLLLFNEKIALHITRPVRWDSDHVVIFDDETKEIAKEIVSTDALDRVFIATDYFDASINRIAAWTIGMRNVQKALLCAMLTPHDILRKLQNDSNFTELLATQEELKFFPYADVWAEYCERNGVVADMSWLDTVKTYENEVLSKR